MLSEKIVRELVAYSCGVQIPSPSTLCGYAAEVIEEQAKEIERLRAQIVHGRWENGNPICPVCGGNKFKDLDADIWSDWQPPFCPNCGAKMDEKNG